MHGPAGLEGVAEGYRVHDGVVKVFVAAGDGLEGAVHGVVPRGGRDGVAEGDGDPDGAVQVLHIAGAGVAEVLVALSRSVCRSVWNVTNLEHIGLSSGVTLHYS